MEAYAARACTFFDPPLHHFEKGIQMSEKEKEAQTKALENKICFVCSKMTAADRAIGEPFTSSCGRWLYINCLKPLGLTRKEVTLLSLDTHEAPKEGLIVAVGKHAAKALKDVATISIPHPMALRKHRDSGETARKITQLGSLLEVTEDRLGVWKGNWPNFVPPKGGEFVYQKHVNAGGKTHHDLRLSSKNSGKAWGWTIVEEGKANPKEEHPSLWLTKKGRLPNGDSLDTLSHGTYEVVFCHDKMCELMLKGLTPEDKTAKITIRKVDDSWVSAIAHENTSRPKCQPFAELTRGLESDQPIIYDHVLTTVGCKADEPLVRISKATTEEKRIVYGTVLDPYIVDAHGDWTPPAEVEKIAHEYLRNNPAVWHMHRKNAPESVVVESWVEQYPTHEDYKKALSNKPHKVNVRKFGDDTIRSGTWNIGVKLSPELWAQYQKGELNAFSPRGIGSREKMRADSMPEITEV